MDSELPDHRAYLASGIRISPEDQLEEAIAMAAAAAPGGLCGVPSCGPAPAPAVGSAAVAPAFGGRGCAEGSAEAESDVAVLPQGLDTGDGDVSNRDDPALAAPVAGGWLLGGKRVAVKSGDGDTGGAEGGRVRGGRRFFGLPFRDEWISATSNRIEKLNSRAPWKHSWTEEVSDTFGFDALDGSGDDERKEGGMGWVGHLIVTCRVGSLRCVALFVVYNHVLFLPSHWLPSNALIRAFGWLFASSAR